MLLYLSRLSLAGIFGRCCRVLLGSDTTGKGRSWRRAGFYQVTKVSSFRKSPRAAGGSFEGQHVCGSRIAGQAAPGAQGVSRAGRGRPRGRRTASGSG
jgi:hypothetical protein